MNELREEELDQIVARVKQGHISDAELGRYYEDAPDDFNASRIKGHLKLCATCAERYAMMSDILATYREVEVPPETTDLMKSIIARVDLRRAMQASLIVAVVGLKIAQSRRHLARFAEGELPIDGQTDDGLLRWRVVQTAAYVEVRMWSHSEELEGSRVAISIGPLSKEILFQSVPGKQVGGEVRIEGEELEQLAEDWELRVVKLDIPDIA